MLALTLLVALPVARGGTPTDTGTSCPNSVIHVFPDSGSSSAFFRTSVEFWLAAADEGATIEVTGPAGAVAGTSRWATSTRLVWEMAAPLSPDADYSATLSYECGEVATSFRTSGVGAPLDAPEALAGRQWSLDLGAGRWVEPYGVGDLLQATVVGSTLDLAVREVGAGGTELWFGCPDDPDAPASAGVFEDPWFSVVVSEGATVGDPGEELVFEPGVALTGAWTADGTRLEGATLDAELDTRPMVDLVVPGGAPDAVCQLFLTFGITCADCPDGTGPYCVHVRVDDLPGAEIDRCFGGEGHTGADDTASDDGPSTAGDTEPGGCGCATSGPQALSAGIGLAAAVGRRRRRRT